MRQRSDRIKSLATISQFHIGALKVQPDRLLIVVDDREIALEPRVMEVLVALAERAGEVLSAEQLLTQVWRGSFYGDNPVHKVIARLRRVVGDDSRAPHFIETIRQRGYRLIAKVNFPNHYRHAMQATALSARSPVDYNAFDCADSELLLGRRRITGELFGAIRAQIDSQQRFVLFVGGSGCGKSSLIRTSVIPLLQQKGGYEGLQALSVAICDFAEARGGDVLMHLAAALAAWRLGERPIFAEQSLADMALTLAQQPKLIRHSVEDAFHKYSSSARVDQAYAHLLLVIDHAEALIASHNIDTDERATFSRILQSLCETPRVMVLMITRSDFYPKLIGAMPDVAKHESGGGHLDVFTRLRPRLTH